MYKSYMSNSSLLWSILSLINMSESEFQKHIHEVLNVYNEVCVCVGRKKILKCYFFLFDVTQSAMKCQ